MTTTKGINVICLSFLSCSTVNWMHRGNYLKEKKGEVKTENGFKPIIKHV